MTDSFENASSRKLSSRVTTDFKMQKFDLGKFINVHLAAGSNVLASMAMFLRATVAAILRAGFLSGRA
jgi:hypothetical protein